MSAPSANPITPEVEPLDVQETPSGAQVTTSVVAKRRGALMRRLGLAPDRVDFTLGFQMPGITRLEIKLQRFSAVLMMSNLPVDETTTRTLCIQARNAMTGAGADADARRRVRKIFEQDRSVVEAVRPQRPPAVRTEQVSVRADRLSIAYRKRVRALQERGWGMSTDWSAEDLAEHRDRRSNQGRYPVQ